MATLQLYKTYSFKNKDPAIDRLRTIVDDEGESYKKIEEKSGVSTTTLYNWFKGATRRPQFATLSAVAGVFGYGYDLVPLHGRMGHNSRSNGHRRNGRRT